MQISRFCVKSAKHFEDGVGHTNSSLSPEKRENNKETISTKSFMQCKYSQYPGKNVEQSSTFVIISRQNA